MIPILEPGRTCAERFTSADAGVLIDGRDYYRAVHQAISQARRSLLIAAWQLDTDVPLLRGDDAARATGPTSLLPLLVERCAACPELEVYILAWDASSLFLLEREPLQSLAFARCGQRRIHVLFDDCHPIGGSHHQKLIVVDRSIAFLGGMDVCWSRWDDRTHLADHPGRVTRLGLAYGPYHDLQAYVTGEAVDTLTAWFAARWECVARAPLVLPRGPRHAIAIEPTLRVPAPTLGLARTLPRLAGVRDESIEELRALHVAAIAAARRSIYIENQYFSSDDVRRALLERMHAGGDALEIVVILPERTKAFKERISMGVRQAAVLRELAATARRTGHRFGAYYAIAPRADGSPVSIYVHAKLLAVDDRFLLVSSANATNRSMGLDSELGLAWEAPRPRRALREVRLELLGEHTGLDRRQARALLAEPRGLVARLDALAGAGLGRLRPHPMHEETVLTRLLPDDLLLDLDGPVLDDALWEATEGGGDRGLFERLGAAWQRLRDGLLAVRAGEQATP
jgi:phospholipase D1/2